MTLQPAPDRELALAAIPGVIHDAGFRPSDLSIRAVGSVEGGEAPCFRVRGWSACWRLLRAAPGTGPEVRIEADVVLAGGEVELDPRAAR